MGLPSRARPGGLQRGPLPRWPACGRRSATAPSSTSPAQLARGAGRGSGPPNERERQIILDMGRPRVGKPQRTLALQQAQLGRVLAMAARVDLAKLVRLLRPWPSLRGCLPVFPGAIGASSSSVIRAPNPGRSERLSGARGGAPLPHNGRKRLLYVGSLNYLPNIDAIDYLVEQIWLPFLNTGRVRADGGGRRPAALIATVPASRDHSDPGSA